MLCCQAKPCTDSGSSHADDLMDVVRIPTTSNNREARETRTLLCSPESVIVCPLTTFSIRETSKTASRRIPWSTSPEVILEPFILHQDQQSACNAGLSTARTRHVSSAFLETPHSCISMTLYLFLQFPKCASSIVRLLTRCSTLALGL